MEIGNKSRAGPDWPGQEVGDMGVGGSGTGGTCHCSMLCCAPLCWKLGKQTILQFHNSSEFRGPVNGAD